MELNVDEIIELCEYEVDREMITGREKKPHAVHFNPVGAMLEMARQLKKAEKDAARYRWLRECNLDESAICSVANPKESVKLGTDCPSGDRLDSFIDEAMKCKQK